MHALFPMYSGAVCMLRFPCTVGLCACFVSHVQWGCVHALFPIYSGAVCMLHFPCTVRLCACFISQANWGSVHVAFPVFIGAVCVLQFPMSLSVFGFSLILFSESCVMEHFALE